jgi:hypothetical protein
VSQIEGEVAWEGVGEVLECVAYPPITFN